VRKRLVSQLVRAVRGSLDRNRHSPFHSLPNLDWPRTIRRNLKNYNPELGMLIPDTTPARTRAGSSRKWNSS
jgi:hypothetical protein